MKDYPRDICKVGQGAACCRYVLGGPNGLECGKHMTGIKAHLDERVAKGIIVARGDNCPGFEDGRIPEDVPSAPELTNSPGPVSAPHNQMEGPVARPLHPSRTR